MPLQSFLVSSIFILIQVTYIKQYIVCVVDYFTKNFSGNKLRESCTGKCKNYNITIFTATCQSHEGRSHDGRYAALPVRYLCPTSIVIVAYKIELFVRLLTAVAVMKSHEGGHALLPYQVQVNKIISINSQKIT